MTIWVANNLAFSLGFNKTFILSCFSVPCCENTILCIAYLVPIPEAAIWYKYVIDNLPLVLYIQFTRHATSECMVQDSPQTE